MIKEHDHLYLVIQSQKGDQESFEQLTGLVDARIRAYIYRMTLDGDVVDEVAQETHLEMTRSLKTLRDPRRFWAWIYRVAMNKTKSHFRSARKEKFVSLSCLEGEDSYYAARSRGEDGFGNLVRKEIREKIFAAIIRLKPTQRALISLRCFDEMHYTDIAAVMECSEMQARVGFFRAKKALKTQLSRSGYGKGSLLIVLTVFGQFTSPSQAAAGGVAVTGSSLSVGVTGTVAGAAATKTGMGVAAAVLLAGASITMMSIYSSRSHLPAKEEVRSLHFTMHSQDQSGGQATSSLSKGAYEQKYHFPDGVDGPMWFWMQRWDTHESFKLCNWLQNDDGNYYYHSGEQRLYLNNYRLWLSSLRVRRLPTDSDAYVAFLDRVEGSVNGMQSVRDTRSGMLSGALDRRFVEVPNYQINYRYNTLNKNAFAFSWNDTVPRTDLRDVMHQRGWTFFRITGEIGGKTVLANGRLPFINTARKNYPPWVSYQIADLYEINDTETRSEVIDSHGKLLAAYPGGSFFRGLARPWMGMHTIDILRRDAAQERVWFETKVSDHAETVNILLYADGPEQKVGLDYTVNMERDLVEKISIFTLPDRQNVVGTLVFDYLDDIEGYEDTFVEPMVTASNVEMTESNGLLWLFDLAASLLEHESQLARATP